MAFVYSEPRWSSKDKESIPGPGSYDYPQKNSDIVCALNNGMPKVYKGSAYRKDCNPDNTFSFQNQSLQLGNIITMSMAAESPKKQRFPQKKLQLQSHTKQCKQVKKKLLGIKSLENNKFNLLKIFEPSENKIILLDSHQTNPSIKDYTRENFYIGPNHNDKSRALHKSTKNMGLKQNLKMRKFTNRNQGDKLLADQISDRNLIGEVFREIKSEVRKKPLSASHPFHKKEFRNHRHENDSKAQLPTGIDDDEDSQYDDHPIPGPGSYNIQVRPKTTKKSMMFTEYKNRFNDSCQPDQQINKKICEQKIYNTSHRYKSKAPQHKVGFGKNIQKDSPMHKIDHQYRFYEYYKSIENTAFFHKTNDELKPGFFMQKQNRITQSPKRKNILNAIETDLKRGSIADNSEDLINNLNRIRSHKQTYQFHCPRNKSTKITEQNHAEFCGQQYGTIKRNMEQKLRREYEQLNYGSLKGKLDCKDSVNIEQNQKKDNINSNIGDIMKSKSPMEIKHGLVQQNTGFRYRQNKKMKKKGYTFAKSPSSSPYSKEIALEQKQLNNFMPPSKNENIWIKKTFNCKFLRS